MKLNKKGFTLVELLAVIVVLAIIMIIAIPSVLKSMSNAKKGAFKIEAQKVLNTAQSVYESDDMLQQAAEKATKHFQYYETEGTILGDGYCYDLEALGISTSNKYWGYVIILVNDKDEATYYLYLSDAGFSATGLQYKDLDNTSGNMIMGNKATAFTLKDSTKCSFLNGLSATNNIKVSPTDFATPEA